MPHAIQELRWDFAKKCNFYAQMLWNKLVLPSEVQTDRMRFWFFEWAYLFQNLLAEFHLSAKTSLNWQGATRIETVFGPFHVRRGTQDPSIISPVFERPDIDYMLSLIQDELKLNHRISFIDVGANIGKFSVCALSRFAGFKLRVFAFEPDPSNFDLLSKNLLPWRERGSQVEVFKMGLSDQESTQRMGINQIRPSDQTLAVREGEASVEVVLKKMDAILRITDLQDSTLMIKIDVEGHELAVLRGAESILSTARRAIVVIEDMLHPEEVYGALQSRGFRPINKLSPYNSWWLKER